MPKASVSCGVRGEGGFEARAFAWLASGCCVERIGRPRPPPPLAPAYLGYDEAVPLIERHV